MLREQVPGINMTQRQVSDHVGRHKGVMLREQVPGINMTQRQVSDQIGRHEGSCCENKSQVLI